MVNSFTPTTAVTRPTQAQADAKEQIHVQLHQQIVDALAELRAALQTTISEANADLLSKAGTTAATTTSAGLMAAADKSKLNGVATGATANASDTQLRDRSTHTGSQPIDTVADLQSTLDGKLATTDIEPVTGLSMRVQNLNVVAGAGQATATWEAPASTVGIQGYEVRYRTIVGSTLGAWVSFAFVAPSVLSCTVTGLTNSQGYQIDVIPVYALTATPTTPALYADLFSGTSTWSAASPRTASDGSTARPWVVYTTSATAWSSALYDGGVRGAAGNQPVAHLLDIGAPSAAKRLRWVWKALLADTTKRRTGCLFRAVSSDAANFFQVHCDGGVWVVRKVVAGAATILATSSITGAAGDAVEVVPGTATDAASVKVNGTVIWSGVDADLASNQYAGFRLQAQASGQTYSQDQTTAVDSFQVFTA
ncbi:fibronectin type III domain-containing protein [Kineococcus radiotolerans]|uniref:Fibronectin type III domain protein n=1 Tax=Kineococcus radiotolerans (strain ATCC BAA-149 / DSM 14245 / SRS30216) TaxID=266940 RepID=A6W8Q0_KINRD|nr:fibronectin type III domain-containing protein [Kineococcus radiotolerans]ABS03189.1 Fibronectin type III domain protein [Kineococcus radiotolerans SRS30216 = ATCC BAA-149]